MITEKELDELLKKLDVPFAYDHFDSTTTRPFIIYRVTDVECKYADDSTFKYFNNYIVDLVVDARVLSLEEQIETIFTDASIPFDKLINFLDSERVYQVRYILS